VVAVVLGGLLAAQAPQKFKSGSGDLPGTMSARVGEALARDFEGGEGQSLVLVYRALSGSGGPADWQQFEDRLIERLGEASRVTGAVSARWLLDEPRGTGASFRRYGIIALNLNSKDTLATEQQVEPLRASVDRAFLGLKGEAPALEWAVTGRAAISHDLNVFSARDTARAELRALPLAR
jgi:uncharacterized membrane protein YdfJ with MMPL/SSD domain